MSLELDLPDAPELPEVPPRFDSHAEHLRLELAWIDLMVRAQVVRWLALVGASRPASAWALLNPSLEEIRDLLALRPGGGHGSVEELEPLAEPWTERGRELRLLVRAARDASSASLPLRELGQRFALEEVDHDLILATLLPKLQPRFRRLYAVLQDDGTRQHASPDLLARILGPLHPELGDARVLCSATREALRTGVLSIEPGDSPAAPRDASPVVLDEAVAAHLAGAAPDHPTLAGLVTGPLPAADLDELGLGVDRRRSLEGLGSAIASVRGSDDRVAAVFFHGPYGSGREVAARYLALRCGRPMYGIDVRAALAWPLPWRRLVADVFRWARLHDAFLLWTNVDVLDATDVDPVKRELLLEAAEQAPVLTVFSGGTPWLARGAFRGAALVRFALPLPSVSTRRTLWGRQLATRSLAGDAGSVAATLAEAFQLTPGQIRDAGAAARGIALRDPNAGGELSATHLESACRLQSGQRLRTLATYVAPREGLDLDAVILPAAPKRQLEELRYRIGNRQTVLHDLQLAGHHRLGQGLLALFSGGSGTGKTMAAEALAALGGVDLYKVNMAALVSKWVGETEKNVDRLLSEAADSNAILFFDEADAVFGKRGDVRSATDRYANQEVNYLLQRIEEYTGVVILATNLRQAVDTGFLRRIHVIVEFPFPPAAQREEIWSRMLDMPSAAVDSDGRRFLAERFTLAGGNIRNIVVDAAFRAHARGSGRTAITLEDVVISVAREYVKLGRPISRSAFSARFFDVVTETVHRPTEGVADGG